MSSESTHGDQKDLGADESRHTAYLSPQEGLGQAVGAHPVGELRPKGMGDGATLQLRKNFGRDERAPDPPEMACRHSCAEDDSMVILHEEIGLVVLEHRR